GDDFGSRFREKVLQKLPAQWPCGVGGGRTVPMPAGPAFRKLKVDEADMDARHLLGDGLAGAKDRRLFRRGQRLVPDALHAVGDGGEREIAAEAGTGERRGEEQQAVVSLRLSAVEEGGARTMRLASPAEPQMQDVGRYRPVRRQCRQQGIVAGEPVL